MQLLLLITLILVSGANYGDVKPILETLGDDRARDAILQAEQLLKAAASIGTLAGNTCEEKIHKNALAPIEKIADKTIADRLIGCLSCGA